MKKKSINIIPLLMVLLYAFNSQCDSDSANDTFGKTFFAQRPQGNNLARRLSGETLYLINCETECMNVIASGAVEYTQTFKNKSLGRYFSFNDTNVMRFAGDQVTTTDRDVRAEYFGLASNFDGTVALLPRVQNVIIDFNARFNLNNWLCGLYFEVGLPINWTKFGMNLKENIVNPGTNFSVGAPAFSHSIIEAWTGKAGSIVVPTIPPTTIVAETGNAAIIRGNQTKWGVPDLRFMFGYNVWCNPCNHLGFYLLVTAPTGNRPKGEFVFEPIVGTGKHTQFGGGISASTVLWQNDCDQSLSIWVEGEAYHLFKAKQRRTFDFTANGIGSRYLTLKQFSNGAFTNTIVPGANVTTLPADVSIGVMGEAVVMFTYQHCDFTWDLGYNFWGRSKEKISKLRAEIPTETYGIAGSLALGNTTKSDATISSQGTVDDPSPVYISNADLNLLSAASPSALSHKIFTHAQYNWQGCNYDGFAGIGGEVEFSGRRNNALNQWGIWVKAGFAYF